MSVGAQLLGVRVWKELSHDEKFRFLMGNCRSALILLASALAIGISLWIAVTSELRREREETESKASKELLMLAKSQAEELGIILRETDQISAKLEEKWQGRASLSIENAAPSGVATLRKRASLAVFDSQRKLVLAENPSQSDRRWSVADIFALHQDDRSGTVLVSALTSTGAESADLFSASKAIRGDHGEILGVVVLVMPGSEFLPGPDDPAELRYGLQTIFAKDGSPRFSTEGGKKPWSQQSLPIQYHSDDSPALFSGDQWFSDHVDRYIASHWIEGYPYRTVVGVDRNSVLSEHFKKQRTFYTVITIADLILLAAAIAAIGASCRIAWDAQRLDAIRDTYRIATECGHEGYFIWSAVRDADGFLFDFEVIDCNEYGASIMNARKETLLFTRLSQLVPIRGCFPKLMKHANTAIEEGVCVAEVEFFAGPNPQRWLSSRMVRCDAGLAVSVRDISEQKRHEKELKRLATTDSLTKIPNRYWLIGHLPDALKRAERLGNEIAVIFVDLDEFKKVNDSLGHAAGDQLLQEVALRLKAALRPGDSVVRFGGDEFMVLLENLAPGGNLLPIIGRILERIEVPLKLQETVLSIGASLGVSRFPRDGADAESLIRSADMAMYAAKEEGRGTYRLYDQAIYEAIESAAEKERELQKAIVEDQFVMYYQPRTDTTSGLLVGMEALIRWLHPERGMIAPDEFIPLAERTGMILALGDLVMEKVLRQMASWRSAGNPVVPVSINVSALQFDNGGISNKIKSLISKYEIPAELVEIELTESAMMGNITEVAKELEAISEQGIKLHVDDFGTGYSSLSMLHKFNMDVLKVDRSFTRQICHGFRGEAFFSAIVSMAKALGMRVVAEGVESVAQLRVLRALGCDEVQGYLLAKPMPADAMLEILKRGQVSENPFLMLFERNP
ncbi:hypothetical protein Lal_00037247 [Lupinus albus]|nr:hypothetical protein Lal_00037247 [Lupinus albus]